MARPVNSSRRKKKKRWGGSIFDRMKEDEKRVTGRRLEGEKETRGERKNEQRKREE